MTDTKAKDGTINHASIKFWMPIIAIIIACTTAFAVLQERVDTVTHTVEAQITRLDTVVDTFVDIQVQLARIQADVSWLRRKSGGQEFSWEVSMEDFLVFGVTGSLVVKRIVNWLKRAGLSTKQALMAAFGVAVVLLGCNELAAMYPAFLVWYERVWNVLFYALVAAEIYDTQKGVGVAGYKWW